MSELEKVVAEVREALAGPFDGSLERTKQHREALERLLEALEDADA